MILPTTSCDFLILYLTKNCKEMPPIWRHICRGLLILNLTTQRRIELNFKVLTAENFYHYSWHPPKDFSFASRLHLVPLYGEEAPHVEKEMPIAIVEGPFGLELVAVCGLHPGGNLFVHDGIWHGNYQPVWMSFYPFVAGEEFNGVTACFFDSDSEFLAEYGVGFPFYAPNYDPVWKTKERLDSMRPYFYKRQETQNVIRMLADANAIIPWPADLQSQFGITIPGLYTLNPNAVSTLAADNPAARNAIGLTDLMQQSMRKVANLAERASRQYF